MTKPNIIVVSAPSGTGKTTLNRRLASEYEQVEISISHTTRKPRAGEVDGTHYHFIPREDFDKIIIKEGFLEWAEVHGNYYGTSLAEIERIQKKGHVALLEIDVQGWLLTRPKIEKALSIFILPPTLEALWQRLSSRGSEDLSVRWLRLQNAYREIEISDHYDYFVVNDTLEEAYKELSSIIVDGKRGEIDAQEGAQLCHKLKEEYKKADWIQELRAEVQKES